jgi:serpin B
MSLSLPVLVLALLPGVSSQDAQSVIAANNQFAFDLYGRLRGTEKNLFLSPYSIVKALAMVYAGARGQTAAEMAEVLHFRLDPESQSRAFAEARKLLNAHKDPSGSKGVQLRLAAGLWGQKGYSFRKDFLALLQDSFGAGLATVDFRRAPEPARLAINGWVEQYTAGKIKDLFPPGMLNPDTRLALVTAIHFKGDWASPFARNATTPEPFFPPSGKKVLVPMMGHTDTFGYLENNDLQALELPYAGGEWAMVVLLPRKVDGLAALEKSLSAEQFAGWMGQLCRREVKVFLPRFTMESAFSLADTLEALGIRRAFGVSADFSGMSAGGEPLYIGAVVHKAFVEVHEEGTEAAAATGVSIAPGAAPGMIHVEPPVFRADHPFLFAIRDLRTGTLLFLGRVVHP